MKIVLIGAGGFLGNNLLRSFLAATKDIELTVLSSSLQSIPGFKVSYYRWPESSLVDDVYKDLFCKAYSIIYAAGAGIQPGSELSEETIYALNLDEPKRLVDSLTGSGFEGQFISFGSYFESGINQHNRLLDEKDFVKQENPLPNAYCRSKKKLTTLHHNYENTRKQFKWLHLVLTNIYGPRENKNRLIPYIISESQLGKPLHFTAGNQSRQYTLIDDVIEVIQSLLIKASGIYHVTNKETVTVKEVIFETVRQVEKNFKIRPALNFDLPGRRDIEMDYLAVNPEKLLKEWNLTCSTSYKQGINCYFDK
jgi:nucleoside-diphosphate-sugar epimerase